MIDLAFTALTLYFFFTVIGTWTFSYWSSEDYTHINQSLCILLVTEGIELCSHAFAFWVYRCRDRDEAFNLPIIAYGENK